MQFATFPIFCLDQYKTLLTKAKITECKKKKKNTKIETKIRWNTKEKLQTIA